ncbi:MAG: hypothetical protein H6591_12400 [Flavobacteriales bacterium]|nr:hypothetical protein [Flavobacteriales bacterium]
MTKTIEDIIGDYDDHYFTHLLNVDWSVENSIQITFRLNFDDWTEGGKQIWRCTGTGYLDSRVNNDPSFSDMRISSDDPLIWITDENRSSIHFTDNNANPDQLKIAFIDTHTKLLDVWVEQDLFVNKLPNHLGILESKFGIFAEGPSRIMEVYAEVFQRFNVKHSLLKGRVQKNEKSRKVFCLGASFFIAEDFVFERLK